MDKTLSGASLPPSAMWHCPFPAGLAGTDLDKPGRDPQEGSQITAPSQWPTWDWNNTVESNSVLWVINTAQIFLIYTDSGDYYCNITMLIWWSLPLQLEGRKQADVIKQAWHTLYRVCSTKQNHKAKPLPLTQFYSTTGTWWQERNFSQNMLGQQPWWQMQ